MLLPDSEACCFQTVRHASLLLPRINNAQCCIRVGMQGCNTERRCGILKTEDSEATTPSVHQACGERARGHAAGEGRQPQADGRPADTRYMV